ncbi:MAG: hypothetical protein M3O62_02570 [Pseudomonadota bacterium]|nr:hypothetical protein [Pseudomonadota bacterium]
MSTLSEVLKTLPDFDPPADGWSRLQARLEPAVPRRRHRAAPLALAASVLMMIAAGWLAYTPAPPSGAPAPSIGAAANDNAVAGLMARSRALESDLDQVRPQVVVWDGRLAATTQTLESRLAMVDLQLNHADADSARRLWQDRVALMSRLVETHQAASRGNSPQQVATAAQEWNL